ncbi:MAG: response regulator transcription factor [Steroidobacteraceae bacterium]|jgi:DNA-binding NarL/FixJ family response regulator
MNYRVLIVDDHPLYRAALIGAIAAACTDTAFIEANSVAGLFDALERDPHADLLLLDLNLPGAYGFSALAHLRGSHPQLPVIVISATDDRRTVRQALAFGAQGFVSKSADAATIGQSIQAALRGELVIPADLGQDGDPGPDSGALELAQRMAQLTPQQFRVYGMLCSGRLNKQIAYDLQIMEATVKAHMTAILRKLGAANRTQAVLLAGRLALDPSQAKLPPEEFD